MAAVRKKIFNCHHAEKKFRKKPLSFLLSAVLLRTLHSALKFRKILKKGIAG